MICTFALMSLGLKRRVLLVVVGAAAVAAAGAGVGVGAAPPEVDLAYHGHVSYWGDELTIRVTSENHGPTAVRDATLRIRVSVPLAVGVQLPPQCLQSGNTEVLCRTGRLAAGATSSETLLRLTTVGGHDEVAVDTDTAWTGGGTDGNPENQRHHVLAPATGDDYAF